MSEIRRLLPADFVLLYEELYDRATSGNGSRTADVGKGPVVRLKLSARGKAAVENYKSRLDEKGMSFAEAEEAGILSGVEIVEELQGEVTEGGVIDVGKPKFERLDTGNGVDGKTWRGGAKAGKKKAGASTHGFLGDERAMRQKDRIDRVLSRLVRDVRAVVMVWDGEVNNEVGTRVCIGLNCSGRWMEAHWLYCPYCGKATQDV